MKISKPHKLGWAVSSLTALGLASSLPATASEFRTIDGFDNNPIDPTLGQAETELIRLFNPAYADDINEPRGGGITLTSILPNPRQLSNTISNQTESVPNSLNASDWFWQWGQFISHDLSLNEGGKDPFFIPVPPSDPLFDIPFLPFTRVPAAPGTGTETGNPRQQINAITSFIDGSNVYGSDSERAEFLRAFDGQGKLKTTESKNGEVLLPFNRADGDNPFPNANPLRAESDSLFLAGESRANEHIGLTAVHTLLVREHNRISEDITQRLENPITPEDNKLVEKFQKSGFDKGNFIYESARKVVGAEIQAITYNEYLPLLIGSELTTVDGIPMEFGGGLGLEAYTGYDPTLDPSVSNEFANAAYRLGHTQLTNQLLRVDHKNTSSIFLGDAFFKPEEVINNGIDSLLLGLASQEAEAIDNLLVDSVRNFLFPSGSGGFDLASVNIQRGRDVGLPSYLDVYNALNLDEVLGAINDFHDLPFAPKVIELFADIYGSVEEIDLWLAGISELPVNGGLVGPTFNLIVSDQFRRARNGDSFFYLKDWEELLVLAPELENTTLSEMIRQNSAVNKIQDNAFIYSGSKSVPEPRSIPSLLVLGALGAGSQLWRKK